MEAEGTGARLLGLDGFVVREVGEVDGELQVHVELAVRRAVGCPTCGVIVGRGALKERPVVRVRDLPVAGRRAVLVWHKRRWRCTEPACPRSSWTETSPHVRARRVLTERARAEICRRVGEDADSVAEVARDYGVGWHTAMAAVRDHGQRRVDDPARLDAVAALGVDETSWLKANRRHHTRYVSGLVDIDTGRLLDVVEDRTARAVADWLAAREPRWLRRVGIVALDPYRGYANAVGQWLGHATLVVDHWHAIRLANAAVDDVRRRVQNATLGHRGRKGDPLYRIRRLLLCAADTLDPRGYWRLIDGLRAGDPDGTVAATWQAKELLRDAYLVCDPAHGAAALEVFHAWCEAHPIPELLRLAATVRRWQPEILAWHATGGRSNARSESCNLAIKRIKRVGRGFRNFDNYRLRLLLHCGVDWHTPPAARLRTRHPRAVA